MNLELALQLVAGCEREAKRIGIAGTAAVLDEGGNLVAQHRMDGAMLGSIRLSERKAYTAVALRAPTERAAMAAAPGAPLYGLQHLGEYVIFGGGAPVTAKGTLIGGLGFSGGTPEQDASVVKESLRAAGY